MENIFVLFSLLILKDICQYSCSICLTWKIRNHTLELICKVDSLRFPIFFDHPSGTEQAYCLPGSMTSSCLSHYKNVFISQNVQTRTTTCTVGRTDDSSITGNWSCLHGSANEIATVHINVHDLTATTPAEYVFLNGPEYARTDEQFTLTCSSSKEPVAATANIEIDGLLYVNLTWHNPGCYMSNTMCIHEECRCSKEGMSYSMQHMGFGRAGVVKFRCIMEFENIGTVSDCIFVRFIDMKGPTIESNTTFPLEVGSIAQLKCIVQTNDSHITIDVTWDCANKKIINTDRYNSTTFINIFSYMPVLADSGTTCICTAKFNDITYTETVRLDIKKALEEYICTSRTTESGLSYEKIVYSVKNRIIIFHSGKGKGYQKTCTHKDITDTTVQLVNMRYILYIGTGVVGCVCVILPAIVIIYQRIRKGFGRFTTERSVYYTIPDSVTIERHVYDLRTPSYEEINEQEELNLYTEPDKDVTDYHEYIELDLL